MISVTIDHVHAGERLHALDALRAGALLLGIFFHATMSFLPGPQLWVVRDVPSPALSVIFYVAHLFRMTLFFLIAGFFARLLHQRLGTRGFLRNRALRIALPFLVFWPLVLAGMAGAFVWASHWTGVTLKQLASLQSASGAVARGIHAVPLTHLWFLYVLTFFYHATVAVQWGLARTDREGNIAEVIDRTLRAIVATPAGAIILAAPASAALILWPNWQGWIGIQAPAIGLVPNSAALIGYSVAFTVGWLIHRQRPLLSDISRWWAIYLGAAVALTALCLWRDRLGPILIARPGTGSGGAYAMLYAIGAWAWTLGLLGAATRYLHADRPVIRYVADASYWIYIVHLPVVMCFQVLVWPLPLPALLKYVLVMLGAVAVLFASYQLLVRRTLLGRWLNGKRATPSTTPGGAIVQVG